MPPGNLVDRVSDVEGSLAALRAELLRSTDRQARLEMPVPMRLAVTVQDPNTSTYPTAASKPNTYWFRFRDGTFARDDGVQTVSWTNRSAAALDVVQNVHQSYLPEGTVIPIWRAGKRWWTAGTRAGVWHGAAQANIAPGAAGNVILLDFTVVSATNWNNTGVTISNGDYVIVWQDPLDNLYYCIKSGGGSGTDRVWKGVVYDSSIAAGAAGNVTLSIGGEVSATYWSINGVTAQQGDKVLVWLDPSDATYNFIMADGAGSGLRMFMGLLNGPCHPEALTAEVDNITAFDGGAAPGSVTVDNPLFLFADDEAIVVFSESPGLGGEEYVLLDVMEVANVLEGYVYSPFTTADDKFLLRIETPYQGAPPYHLGAPQETVMVKNIPRSVDPNDRGPYLFEGEFGAVCRAEIWPEATAADRAALGTTFAYRSVWVECPEISPVETSPGGSMAASIGSDLYSQGGAPAGVSASHYYGG